MDPDCDETRGFHSRNTLMGSTEIARQLGPTHAISAPANKTAVASRYAVGSE